ncbi:MAG: type IV secretion system DNA-binding domain-containing protein [Candidatus Pacebacteria bacterium]|nr:type IV secretion system DNA-binding domain-containing protein [Candidatus Paceibacterota bacterium]
MSAKHILLELRTSRDAEHTPETATQLFATLPKLKNNILYKWLRTDEHISFEILSLNQTIYFLAYIPERLTEYVKSILQATYPEILINELNFDPIDHFVNIYQNKDEMNFSNDQSHFLSLGYLKLSKPDYLPLKDYKDFSDIDPLSTVLSVLSKTGPFDKIGIQLVLSKNNESWKNSGRSQTDKKSQSNGSESIHPQRELIQKKLKSTSLKTSIRLVVSSNTQERADIILENLTTSFQAITYSESNTFVLWKSYLFKNLFIKDLKGRYFGFNNNFHLSLEELATIYHLPNKGLATIPNIAWGKNLLGEPPENLPIILRGMDVQDKREINPYAKVIHKNQEVVYGLKRSDRRRHMYVIGKTGTGKSTMLANMAINDLKNGEGLCVIDPHGDLVETLLDYIPSNRINDVVYFDPGDKERSIKLNLFEGENVQHRELIASGIISIFHKLYSYSWGPRLEYILRNALLTLLQSKTAKMSDIIDLLTNERYREKVVDNLEDPILKGFWVDEFDKMQPRQMTEAIAPILNKIGQFVTSPIIRNVVNANKSSFSIEDIMNERKILLVNLSQGKLGEDNATLLGAMLITKIQLAAMGRVYVTEEERKDFFLYVDEFQNFATESFNKILSEARKYRLNLILANQYIAQIPEEVQKAIFGNCGTMASFVMGSDDAAVFAKEYGEKYTSEDLVSLSRHQIINKISIDNIVSQPFPALTLPPAKSKNKNKNKVIQVSRERYGKAR